jgi:N utilization substance protein B
MALYEGVVEKLTPVAVAISEAVELVKRFGTKDSGRFVNGVLGRIVRELDKESTLGDGGQG